MYDIAAQVAAWTGAGRTVHVGLLVATRGFSSLEPGACTAVTDDGAVVGALLPGGGPSLPPADGRLVEVVVSDADAEAAGLSCGGVATVLVAPATTFPARMWQLLEQREPLCLVGVLEAASPVAFEVFTREDIRDATRIDGAHEVPRLFARGTTATSVHTEGDRSVVVVALWPSTTLVVVGDGLIAHALSAAAALLGWQCVVTDSAGQAVPLAQGLTRSDAAVVLSHDRAVDVPVLAALLTSRAGYVGALGSRATQAARRDGLLARGFGDEQLALVHGPAGLDVDAHTPAEIAVSIVAEVLAVRAGTSGGSLSSRGGPVHTAGVHAPPPRY